SSSSTSDGILKVFEKANKYQETSSEEFSVISVVVLDEVLHALLEPNYPSDGPSVSVVGISNWRLDNSKSSRALLVQRPKFGIDDLVDTAVRLLGSKLHNSITRASLRPLAEAYSEYEGCGQSHSNFHGLRDYYGLNPYGEYFDTVLKTFNNYQDCTYNPIPTLTLIKANLDDESARHLMVFGKSDSIVTILTYQLIEKGLDPVVILGSQFQDDQQDYSYNVLSRIMMCVEAGRPLILTDLEIIYGALYDLWSQNYIVVGSKNDPKYYTRVALGAYANPMLCILVLDEKKSATADPPLLNRIEKQRLTIDDTLTNNHQKIDLFIGFDENETLQSLVIDVMTKFPEDNEEAIIKRCKAALIDIASSDGIIRASRSNMDPRELINDLFACQVDKLSTFKTEAQLQNRIKRFWEESEDQMLILQCDVTTVNAGCIKLAKFIIEQFQNEFLRKNPDHIKYVCITLHIQREQNYMSSFNFMCGWKQVTIETLTPQEKNLSTILNGSLADIIKNEYKVEDILKHELLWCLLCIKYPST
ncbi:12063_t:CDS:2, partial [Gigaspora margarita]